MKIVKTVLRFLMYGIVLFIMSGIMFSMIKNSDKGANSKKIFDDTRNFSKVKDKNYTPTAGKPYYEDKIEICANSKKDVDKFLENANKYNMDTSADACRMSNNLKVVISLMETMKNNSCRQFDKSTFNTSSMLFKISTSKCAQQ